MADEAVIKPWGLYQVLYQDRKFWVKRLVVMPEHSLSLQSHKHRSEVWVGVEGQGTATIIDYPRTLKNGDIHHLEPGVRVEVPLGAKHKLSNPFNEPLQVIEIALGDPLDEDDIERFWDLYGRI